MDSITALLSIVVKLITAVGIGVAAWNVVQLGNNIKDKNGPEAKDSLLGILGGGAIIAAAQIIGQIDLNF